MTAQTAPDSAPAPEPVIDPIIAAEPPHDAAPPTITVPQPRQPAGTPAGARHRVERGGFSRSGEFASRPATVAVAVWLVLIGPLVALPRMVPFDWPGVKGLALPLAAGLAGGAVLLALAVWRRGAPWVAGASAGFLASWVTLMLGTVLRGTPFGFYGVQGDAGQLSAMAMRYSVTVGTADPWLPGVPAEYPPLFPWLVGRTGAIFDIPAWQLVGAGQVIMTGLALLAGFLLWQRLVPAWVALGVTSLGLMVFAYPPKAFEVVTLMMFIPWAIGTFGRPARGRLHWLVSGIVAGLIVLTYYGWVIFGAVGLVTIAIMSLRRERNRRAYLAYLAKVVGVATVVSSWFVLPYAYALVTNGGESFSDRYADLSLIHGLLPFIGFSPLEILQLVGVVGLFWLRGSTTAWWASPMLALVIGAYAFRAFSALSFLLTGHTWMGHYTPRLYSTVLAMAGVLTLVHAVPRLLERLTLTAPRGGGTAVLSVALVWAGLTFTLDWMPAAGGRYAGISEIAYLEPLPDGRYVADLPRTRSTWFPVAPVQRVVEGVYGGPNRDHVVLSADERLFSFLPWPGYAGSTPGGALAHTPERWAELQRLATTTDSDDFTQASATTAFGAIDIFVLRETPEGWRWSSYAGFNTDEIVVLFQPSQFDTDDWAVFTSLPADVVVAVRRP